MGAAELPAPRRRPPRVVLVVACSQRKRTTPPIELCLSSIKTPSDQRAMEWTRRIRQVEAAKYRAENLYAGDHWRAACDAYRLALEYSSRTELWVVSAGYGLISSRRTIKPYSATFADKSADSVWRGYMDGDRCASLMNWWHALPHDATIGDLLEDDGIVVIAAGAPYLTALTADLITAFERDASGDRISLISAGTQRDVPVLPVTGTFRTVLGGTYAALNARLLRLLAADAPTHEWKRSAMEASLRRIEASIPRVVSPVRQSTTDDAIAMHIKAMRDQNPKTSRTAGLRRLRACGVACEQRRFEAIWERTSLDLAPYILAE